VVVLVNVVQRAVVKLVLKVHRVSKVLRVTRVLLVHVLVVHQVPWEAREHLGQTVCLDLREMLVLQDLRVCLVTLALLVTVVSLVKWVERVSVVLKEIKDCKANQAMAVHMVQRVLAVM